MIEIGHVTKMFFIYKHSVDYLHSTYYINVFFFINASN